MTDSTDSNHSPNVTLEIPIVIAGLAPYRITLLNRLMTLPQLHLSALLSEGDWRFQNQSVGLERARFPLQVFNRFKINFNSARADRTGLSFSPSLWRHLAVTKYNIMVAFGWTSPDTLAALLIAKWRNLPIVLWDTSIPHAPGRLKRLLMPLLRKMFGAFDGYFVPSTLSAEYFVSMGARATDITLIPQVVDSAAFWRAAEKEIPERETRKAALGITTSQVILFVGQLTARKGLDVLLDAFHQLCAQSDDVSLLLVGEGPLQVELQDRARAVGVSDRVFFGGYVARADLPKYYVMADIFTLPSWYDTFGVVILEAMACGLPVITTSSVGAARDLIRDGENGFVVEYGDVASLANTLQQVLQNETRRAAMSACSRELIGSWNLDLAAAHFEKAVWSLWRTRRIKTNG